MMSIQSEGIFNVELTDQTLHRLEIKQATACPRAILCEILWWWFEYDTLMNRLKKKP